jgi:hypothetical protein
MQIMSAPEPSSKIYLSRAAETTMWRGAGAGRVAMKLS